MKIQIQYFDKDSLFFRGFLIFVAMKPQNIGEHTPVGILGGGQLGKMLIQAASDLNIHIHCLDEDPNAPCAALAHSYTIGSIRDYDTVLNFGRSKKIVTVEIENVNIEALELLEKEGVLVYPQPAVLRLIKDKGIQK
jgi:5-(carboxyamino)imidazole ribonucleotide synthase